MKFTIFTTFINFLAVSLNSVSCFPVLEQRDVFVPPVTFPKKSTIWHVGERQHVLWDTTRHPINITNKVGRIFLRKGEFTTPLILANDFDILLGRIGVTVPWVEDGQDYQVVVFGDSGNFSPYFTITGSGVDW
ncbi:hypothetical protein CPB84DRAFT_1810441 [Gymnopilus junonius]|uniref:Uncharacterized protein n=1 Tax=Gymnopilus junonius TaxID=109634 RepID=A0A9P5N6G8_GYMJU|nr:hypothetical protein CPB84DRAFT_1810441 [Gymnopilus junonius]